MERDNLHNISKGGRISVDEYQLDSDRERIKEIEQGLSKSAFEKKIGPSLADAAKIAVAGAVDLKRNLAMRDLDMAGKKVVDQFKDKLARLEGSGNIKQLHKFLEETDEATLKEQFRALTGDAPEDLQNKYWGKVHSVIKNSQRGVQRKINSAMAKERLTVAEQYQKQIVDLARSQGSVKLDDTLEKMIEYNTLGGLYEDHRKEEIKAAVLRSPEYKIAQLDYSIRYDDEETSMAKLEDAAGVLTSAQYLSRKKKISTRAATLNKEGLKAIKDAHWGDVNLYRVTNPQAPVAKVLDRYVARLMSKASKGDYTPPMNKIELARVSKDHGLDIRQTADLTRALNKRLKEDRREIIKSNIDPSKWSVMSEEDKYAITGQATTRETRAKLQVEMHGAFLEGEASATRLREEYNNKYGKEIADIMIEETTDMWDESKAAPGGRKLATLARAFYEYGGLKSMSPSLSFAAMHDKRSGPLTIEQKRRIREDASYTDDVEEYHATLAQFPGGAALIEDAHVRAMYVVNQKFNPEWHLGAEENMSKTGGYGHPGTYEWVEAYREEHARNLKALIEDDYFSEDGAFTKLEGVGLAGSSLYLPNSQVDRIARSKESIQEIKELIDTGNLSYAEFVSPDQRNGDYAMVSNQNGKITIAYKPFTPLFGDESPWEMVVDHDGKVVEATVSELLHRGTKAFETPVDITEIVTYIDNAPRDFYKGAEGFIPSSILNELQPGMTLRNPASTTKSSSVLEMPVSNDEMNKMAGISYDESFGSKGNWNVIVKAAAIKESDGHYRAESKASREAGAEGVFQIKKSNWEKYKKQHNLKGSILDPVNQAIMLKEHTKEGLKEAKKIPGYEKFNPKTKALLMAAYHFAGHQEFKKGRGEKTAKLLEDVFVRGEKLEQRHMYPNAYNYVVGVGILTGALTLNDLRAHAGMTKKERDAHNKKAQKTWDEWQRRRDRFMNKRRWDFMGGKW